MNSTPNNIPHSNVFGLSRRSHGVILDEFNVSRLSAAGQGLEAVLAVLHQRELDAETLNGEGVGFGPEVALGLLAAAAICADALTHAIDGGGGVAHAFYGTAAYDHLATAKTKIVDASRKATP